MSDKPDGSGPAVTCPKCGASIQITEALGAEVERRIRSECMQEFSVQQRAEREEFERRLQITKDSAAALERETQAMEMEDLRQRLTLKEQQVEALRETELNLRQRERELADRTKALEVETARRLQEESTKVEAAVSQRLAEQHRLADLAKDKQLADLRQQLEEATRRANQGSQQTQGEALEVNLEEGLRHAFPEDQIEAVQVGHRGGDILHGVRDARGAGIGKILWETKNTKLFSETWLVKLREDQRECGAVVAVVVTKAMPEDVTHFGWRDGIWICSPATAIPLGTALRYGLVETARARVASQNQNEKQAALYAYLSGIEFKQRIEAILEPLLLLLNEHERERRALEAGWARREKAINQAITSLALLYGGVGGVVGGILPRIERLDLPAPDNEAA